MAELGCNADGRAAIPPASLAAIYAAWTRCVAYPDANIISWIQGCHARGVRVLLVLASESIGKNPGLWAGNIAMYRDRYGSLVDAWQLGNEADHVSPSSWTMTQAELGQLLRAGRNVLGPDAYIVGAGMVSGNPGWAAGVNWGPVSAIACLVPDQRVTARNPTLATMRQYDGDVITIQTASGNEVTCTPNHPILTRQGWLPASEIHEGSEIVQHKRGDRMESGRANDIEVPTRIADVFRSLNAPELVRPGLPLDFHGDGRYTDVHIVVTNRLLGDTLPERVQQLNFQPPLTRASEFSRRGMNRLQSLSLPWPLETQALSVGPPSRRQAVTLEQRVQSTIQYTDFLRKSDDRLSRHMALMQGENVAVRPPTRPTPGPDQESTALEQPAKRSTGLSDTGRDLLERLAGQVAFVKVSHVGVSQFRGHVYNLTTEDGLIVADGIITHNCHPYAKEPHTAPLDALLRGYKALGKPLWITEYHARTLGMAAALRDDPRLEVALAFCYTDRMVPGFGMIEDYRALDDFRTAAAPQAPSHPPTERHAVFQAGFLDWSRRDPALLGTPLENESGGIPGFSVQRTSTGRLMAQYLAHPETRKIRGWTLTFWEDGTGARYLFANGRSEQIA